MLNKYQNLFRSRWKALWWAAGVCLTAYCTVPSPKPAAQQQQQAAQPKHHANPWALDKTADDRG
jgi:hypothetical protein